MGSIKTGLIFLIFILITFSANAQESYAISGTVNDEKGGALPGATVFINNTKHVTSTNSTGHFNFEGIKPGIYEVAVKMMGFNPAIQRVNLREQSAAISIKLSENITLLNTVNIKAKRDEITRTQRANYLQRFLDNFIGQTVNAEQCKLLNPDVLQYEMDKRGSVLHVSADQFLIVENKALGYNLKYLLTNFEDNVITNICQIEGYPYFEEIKGDAKQQAKWEENRRIAYLSSPRCFFRALMNDQLRKAGFQVFQIVTDTAVMEEMRTGMHPADKKTYFPFKEYTRTEMKFQDYYKPKKPDAFAYRVFQTDTLFVKDKRGLRNLTVKDTSVSGMFIVYTGQRNRRAH
jgi:hypothetical protein